MSTGDGGLWLINSKTVRLLEVLEDARKSLFIAFESGKLKTDADVAAAVAVLRNLRSVQEAIEFIAKEEDYNEKDRGAEGSVD